MVAQRVFRSAPPQYVGLKRRKLQASPDGNPKVISAKKSRGVMDGAKLLWVRLGQFWLVGAAIGAPGSGRRDIHFVSIMTRQVTIDWGHVERASTARLPIALYYQCPVQNDFTRRQAVRLEGCSTITASRLRRYVFCFQLDGRSHTRTQLAEAYKRWRNYLMQLSKM
jgi:hypothetical protein